MPRRNPEKEKLMGVTSYRIIIIPLPTPKPHAPAPVVCLALLQASSACPSTRGEAVKEGGASAPSSRAGSLWPATLLPCQQQIH